MNASTVVQSSTEVTNAHAAEDLLTSRSERQAIRICIAIPTYRRLELLPNLLARIAAQDVDDSSIVEVVILDNNPDATARPFTLHSREAFPFVLHYEHVPEPGLSSVRNRALTFVTGRFDFMAMIDDDEWPEEQWLRELVRASRYTSAAVVVGPVFPIVPHGAAPWLAKLRAKETPMHRDLASLRDGWSCNALVNLAAVDRLGVSFDPALNFAGGEDQLFFRQMLAGGATIVFAARAIVREVIPPDRLTVSFNLRRAFRYGNSLAFCDRTINPRTGALIVRAVKGCARIGLGLVRMPAAFALGKSAVVLEACDVAKGLGMLAGLMGRMYSPYQRST